MVKNKSDDELWHMNLGGHDPVKVHAAYQAAMNSNRPTVIIARTIKGYGMGEAGEGKNITHQQKKMNEEELQAFRDRFNIPISDEALSTRTSTSPTPTPRRCATCTSVARLWAVTCPAARATARRRSPCRPTSRSCRVRRGLEGPKDQHHDGVCPCAC